MKRIFVIILAAVSIHGCGTLRNRESKAESSTTANDLSETRESNRSLVDSLVRRIAVSAEDFEATIREYPMSRADSVPVVEIEVKAKKVRIDENLESRVEVSEKDSSLSLSHFASKTESATEHVRVSDRRLPNLRLSAVLAVLFALYFLIRYKQRT